MNESTNNLSTMFRAFSFLKEWLSFFVILVTGLQVFFSCSKEYSCEGCRDGNIPPIANAGPDQAITLPTDSVLMDGSGSSDPDGNVNEWLWTKIAGPDTFAIAHSYDSITKVNTLVAGTYLFELTVTDNGGLSAKDSVQVIVKDPLQPNRPPVARAGADTTITLPDNTMSLDGSGSTDPDNNIIAYAWTKIAGPLSSNITDANSAKTQVTNVVQGTYLFELKVTDAGGLTAKDTIQFTVNAAINTNCIPSQTLIGSLSIHRSPVNIIEAGNKVLFAGGFVGSSGPPMYGASSRVDIYDRANQTWATAELSLTRFAMGITSLDNKIYLAGGDNGKPCSRVDIYDASSNKWSTAELSEPREDVIAVATGNKVLFAGGIAIGGGSSRVDIFDQANGTWSTAELSHPTWGDYPGYYVFAQSGVITVGNKIYFMTSSNSIDIYDAQANTWSTHPVSPNDLTQGRVVSIDNKLYFSGSDRTNITPQYVYANSLETYDISSGNWSSAKMSQSRANMAAITGDGKIFWAGGFDSSWDANGEQAIRPLKNIEIYDVNTGLRSFHDLQQPEWWVKTLKTNNKIFFSYGKYTEIYDMNSHSWTICNIFLDQALAIGNTVYQVGLDSRVWKLEF